MDREQLRTLWHAEETHAFQGWDFSHLDGRWADDDLPWDYRALALELLRPGVRLLDMGTGGGEFLLSLGHPHRLTTVTEGYPPNAALCRERLAPLGVTVAEADGEGPLPFPDGSFDVVLDRHESFLPEEVFRVLAPGGTFLTQQVGGRNNNGLSQRLIPGFRPPYPDFGLEETAGQLTQAGFQVLQGRESFPRLRFFDVGAVVFFAKVIPWEFPGFTVDGCFDALLDLQREIEVRGSVESIEHRFFLLARK